MTETRAESGASTTPRQPRRTRGGLARREMILEVAQRLFGARGFAGVSMPALAAACGITAGAIYKHFESKEHLFFEVIRRAIEAAPIGGEPTGADGIPEAVAVYTTARLKLVRQFAVEVHYAAAKDPKVKRLLSHSVERDAQSIGEAIAAAQAAGEVDASLDPALTGALIMSLIMGLMHGETLAPKLVGEAKWRAFVAARVAALLGLKAG